MSLERAGVPTVAVHTDPFVRLARASALASGMPTARQAFVPHPVVGRTPPQLRGYIEGSDPVAKRPFMQEVLEGLTRPLDDKDLKGVSFERSTPRLVPPATEEELQQLFIENKWTDFLPVMLPTEERVAAMLRGTSRKPDEVVGRLAPTAFREAWEFTVEKVAVNAVMAGCRPEYLPVVLALAASGQTARSSSTTSFATLAMVNGPIRNEIGMDSGIGVLGPFNHANATIGRAYNLLSQNLQGGSVPGETYMGSLGNWYNYSACFPEAEERSPWPPFHVQKGFKAEESVASVFFGGRYTLAGFGPRETWQEEFRRVFAACEQHLAPLLVLDPLAARGFVELGFDTKEKLAEWLSDNGRLSAREYWDNQWVQTLFRSLAVAGVEPYAAKYKAKPDELIRVYEPGQISIAVAGGETQGAWRMFGGRYVKSVSIDAWR
ncbi:MAG TPA: UGSC family (seleno)protein [Burkholderiales bacterium]|nr:UGSC family (seleno)protein [Burkholderiales bacterium]